MKLVFENADDFRQALTAFGVVMESPRIDPQSRKGVAEIVLYFQRFLAENPKHYGVLLAGWELFMKQATASDSLSKDPWYGSPKGFKGGMPKTIKMDMEEWSVC